METTKSRIIFFAIAITYNLLLGWYLKDFLALSQTLAAFYLLSVFPTLFLVIEARSRPMRTIAYIVLALDILVNLIYFICCRRLLPVITMLLLVTELMYCITGTVRTSKDSLVTKFVQAVIPIPKRRRQFTVGSFKTLSTIMTTAHPSSISMFVKHYTPIKVSAKISSTSSPPSVVAKISLATL